MRVCGTPLLRLLPLFICVCGPRKGMWVCPIPDGNCGGGGDAPLAGGSSLASALSSGQGLGPLGSSDRIRFGRLGFPPRCGLGCAGGEVRSAGVNSGAGVDCLLLGHPGSFWGHRTSQQFRSPALLWSLHGGFGRAAQRAFYPGISLLPCVFIHCPQLEAPVLALSIK